MSSSSSSSPHFNQLVNELDQFIHNSIISHATSIFSSDGDERSLIFTAHSAFPFNLEKDNPLLTSKTAIEALTKVIAAVEDDCAICLVEDGGGEMKEMSCKCRFHEGCIKNVSGTCPVCHYKMPLNQEKDVSGGCW